LAPSPDPAAADAPQGNRWALSGRSATPAFAAAAANDSDEIDLLELWRSVSKRKWSILGLVLVVGLLSLAVVLSMAPVYRANTVMMFDTGKSQVVSIEDVYAGAAGNREFLATQLEIVGSREVALKTVQALKLWDHPEFDPRLPQTGPWQDTLGWLRQTLGMVEPEVAIEWTPELLASAVVVPFQSRVEVELLRNSLIANVSFEANDPDLAARAANAVSRVFIENDLNARYEMTRQATNWLQERVTDLKDKVLVSERALQSFRERSGIISAQGAAQSGSSGQLEGLTSRLIDARLRRTDAETAYNQVRNAARGADLSEIPAVLRAPGVAEAKRNVQDAERKFAEVAQRYGFEHPRHVAAKAEVEASRSSLKSQLDTTVASIKREFEAAQSVEREIERTLGQARSSVQTLNRAEFELGVLQREVESNREMYNMFMTRAKETTSTSDLQSPIARVVDPALVPSAPVKPRKGVIVGVAMLLALLAGVGASLLIDQLDKTLKTADDVERKLGVPLLTTLPLLGKADARRAASSRMFSEQPNSVFSEAVRTARSGVLLSALDSPHRMLVVTSSLPGEGKSTFAINLALSHAQNQKTLLIDADMRRPSVARSLDLPPGTPGLSNFVAGSKPWAECVQQLQGSDLSVMPSGPLPPNPLEMISSKRFRERMAELAQQFDIIIIDSPPVELVSDALMLASMASGVVYVTKAMSTATPMVSKGLERVRRADGQVLGLVLNHFDFKRASKYYGDYSGYGKYGYGKKGYGSAYGEGYTSKAT
jgi:capsular exopolysaccharide synthesis family protein